LKGDNLCKQHNFECSHDNAMKISIKESFLFTMYLIEIFISRYSFCHDIIISDVQYGFLWILHIAIITGKIITITIINMMPV